MRRNKEKFKNKDEKIQSNNKHNVKISFLNTKTIVISLFVIFLITFSFTIFNYFNLINYINDAVKLAEEEARPADVEITKITFSECEDCFVIDNILSAIKQQNINITNEISYDYSSPEAAALIEQYNISSLPTFIVKGEIDKYDELSNLLKLYGRQWDEDIIVYNKADPPYYDLSNAEIVGKVSVIRIVDNSCEECLGISNVIDVFKQLGVVIVSDEEVSYDSEKGQALIEKYGIRKVPAIIVSNNIIEYGDIQQIWSQLNATEKYGKYALHTVNPPYRDVVTDELVGLVELIYLDDESCTECYDVSGHKKILSQFGIVFSEERVVDISSEEGKKLIEKYNITMVPIIILSPDADEYSSLKQAWNQVGSVESDGWYVFRETGLSGMGVSYKDLSTGDIK